MILHVIILDQRPDFLAEVPGTLTLLQMPFGQASLLHYLRNAVAELGDAELSIVPSNTIDGEYARFIAAEGNVPTYGHAELTPLLETWEPADWLLIVDPANFPPEGLGLRDLQRQVFRTRTVTHLVARPAEGDESVEQVLVDMHGRIRRIQRYYEGVTRVDRCRVACSMMPAAVAQIGLESPLTSLFELRQLLTGYGIPSQDLACNGEVVDLGTRHGWLTLMERWMFGVGASAAGPMDSQAISFGHGCAVHPTARLHGPVALHDGAIVEADATIMGPAIVGAGGVVGRRSVVARSVVLAGGRVPAGTVAFRQVLGAALTCGDDAIDDEIPPHSEEPVAGVVGLDSHGNPVHKATLVVKRIVDIVLSASGLLLLLPVLLVMALLVKLTSGGPVFFAHIREGLGGREFRCWKFRTMVPNAHALQRKMYAQNEVDGPQFKLARDPRITWIGHWLRKTNIDELPQLWNVLIGQMSLIGPRPSPFRENQICVPWREARLSVRPGITGLWQICRHERAAGDFHQWIYYDMLYVRHLSMALDVKIVLYTFLTLAGRWSVPLTWLIPTQVLSGDARTSVPLRAPILELPSRVGSEPGAAMGGATQAAEVSV